MRSEPRRPSSAFVLALIALVVALAGTATALPGKNTVDKNDIKKNAVKSASIKDGEVSSADIGDGQVSSADLGDGQVSSADLADGQVGSADLGDGQVSPADLAPSEAPRVVGTAGQPAFETGGDGDCLWQNLNAVDLQLGPVLGNASFYKDPYGIVHLSGVAVLSDDTGGDGECAGASADDFGRDQTAFILPPGYRPAKAQLIGGIDGGQAIIVGVQALEPGPTEVPIPPGAVNGPGSTTTVVSLDGISFPAAPATVARAAAKKEPVTLPRALGRSLFGG